MWQRVQTLYMILVIGLMITATLLPDVDFIDNVTHTEYQLNSIGLVQLDSQDFVLKNLFPNPTTYLLAIILFLSTFVIAKYKNRKLQFRLATVNLIFILLYILTTTGFVVYSYYELHLLFYLQYASVLPIVALIFNILAMRGIRKDENLIRSMDRLR